MAQNITHKDRATDLGSVRINNDAIATIASVAARDAFHHLCCQSLAREAFRARCDWQRPGRQRRTGGGLGQVEQLAARHRYTLLQSVVHKAHRPVARR